MLFVRPNPSVWDVGHDLLSSVRGIVVGDFLRHHVARILAQHCGSAFELATTRHLCFFSGRGGCGADIASALRPGSYPHRPFRRRQGDLLQRHTRQQP